MVEDRTSAAGDRLTDKRVAVIGNSYIGALRKACVNAPDLAAGFRFSFFARAGSDFSQVRIDDGSVSEISDFDDRDFDIAGFDFALVYGDFPPPDTVLQYARKVNPSRFSEQLLQARLREWAALYHNAYRLVQSLVALQGPKVFVLSRNPRADEAVRFDDAYCEALDIVAGLISPAIHVPAPRALFSPDGLPRAEFYAGSLDMKGEEPDRDLQPEHHLAHFNEAGGRLVLAALAERFAAS